MSWKLAVQMPVISVLGYAAWNLSWKNTRRVSIENACYKSCICLENNLTAQTFLFRSFWQNQNCIIIKLFTVVICLSSAFFVDTDSWEMKNLISHKKRTYWHQTTCSVKKHSELQFVWVFILEKRFLVCNLWYKLHTTDSCDGAYLVSSFGWIPIFL